MSEHRAATPMDSSDHRGGRRSTAWRVGGVAAVVSVLVAIALTSVGTTGAYWVGQTTVDPGTVRTGTLDVTLSPEGGAQGNAITLSGFGLGDMLPGDSRAAVITVRNSSVAAPLEYSVRGRATTAGLGDALRVQLTAGGTASNTGTTSTGYSGTCAGGSVIGPETTLALTDTALTTAPVGPLAPAGTRNICVRVSLPATAAQTAQNKTSVITLTFDARSVLR